MCGAEGGCVDGVSMVPLVAHVFFCASDAIPLIQPTIHGA